MWRRLTRTSSPPGDPAAGTPSMRSQEARERRGAPTCPRLWHSLISTSLATRKMTARKARTLQRKKRRLKLKAPKVKGAPCTDLRAPVGSQKTPAFHSRFCIERETH